MSRAAADTLAPSRVTEARRKSRLTPFAVHFSAAETARTMAWRALEAGEQATAAVACRQAATAFIRAAERAEGRTPCR